MEPSDSRVSRESKNGRHPFSFFSTVNWMCLSMLFKCSCRDVRDFVGTAVHVSSTYLFQKRGGVPG